MKVVPARIGSDIQQISLEANFVQVQRLCDCIDVIVERPDGGHTVIRIESENKIRLLSHTDDFKQKA